MTRMAEFVELDSGTPQFRIVESPNADAPAYFFFGQKDMEDDLPEAETLGSSSNNNNSSSRKHIRTFDNVNTLKSGDLVFSLISGKATIVQNSYSGHLFTQNYVRLKPSPSIDAGYLVYMLNENADIRRQLLSSQQGSVTLKFTIKQLSDLKLPTPPPIEKQRLIGELYANQLKLTALRKRVAATEAMLLIAKLKEANKS